MKAPNWLQQKFVASYTRQQLRSSSAERTWLRGKQFLTVRIGRKNLTREDWEGNRELTERVMRQFAELLLINANLNNAKLAFVREGRFNAASWVENAHGSFSLQHEQDATPIVASTSRLHRWLSDGFSRAYSTSISTHSKRMWSAVDALRYVCKGYKHSAESVTNFRHVALSRSLKAPKRKAELKQLTENGLLAALGTCLQQNRLEEAACVLKELEYQHKSNVLKRRNQRNEVKKRTAYRASKQPVHEQSAEQLVRTEEGRKHYVKTLKIRRVTLLDEAFQCQAADDMHEASKKVVNVKSNMRERRLSIEVRRLQAKRRLNERKNKAVARFFGNCKRGSYEVEFKRLQNLKTTQRFLSLDNQAVYDALRRLLE